MAKMVLKDCYISINSQNYSANVSKVELEMEGDDQDVTTFGSGGWKEILQGLKSGSLSVTFKDDFADSAVDDLLWAVFNAGSNVAFELRPTQSAVSVNNPKYTGNLTPDCVGRSSNATLLPALNKIGRAHV